MPFQSQAQARAAFGGYLGPEMKAKADEFARATSGGINGIKSLPQHVQRQTQRKAILKHLTKGQT